MHTFTYIKTTKLSAEFSTEYGIWLNYFLICILLLLRALTLKWGLRNTLRSLWILNLVFDSEEILNYCSEISHTIIRGLSCYGSDPNTIISYRTSCNTFIKNIFSINQVTARLLFRDYRKSHNCSTAFLKETGLRLSWSLINYNVK